MGRFVLIAAAVLVGILLLKALAVAVEPRLVFFPAGGEDRNPAALGIRYDVVHLETTDGETLVAWQLEPDAPIADVVYFHGNGGNLSVWLPVLATLHAAGLRVLALDYRGYGLSSGRPSETGLYRDAEAAVRHAVRERRSAPARPLVFWGRSLGGPVAASAVRTAAPDGLVLESTFAEKAAVVRSNPILRLLNVFAAYRFDTLAPLRDYHNPVLVLHGDRDTIIPVALGRELHARLRPPKRMVEVGGADHNDLIDLSRRDYWRPVLDFMASLRTAP